MEYWEFEECWQGYLARYKIDEYRMAQSAIWNGKFKKGMTVKKLLGYDPMSNGNEKEITKEDLAEMKRKNDEALPVLDSIGIMKLKRKIKEAKDK